MKQRQLRDVAVATPEVVDRVRRVVREVLRERVANLGDADFLLEAGVVDSLALVALIDRLESAFSFEIQPDDLAPENFESINAIAGYVERSC